MDIMAVRPTEARARSQTPKLGPYSVPWEPTDVDHQECGQLLRTKKRYAFCDRNLSVLQYPCSVNMLASQSSC
ncbi:hypothetical protein ACN38_g3144 [Penicillium nordicum]|uniref:Uncharacterized protein n=1 Tax=Penicillium nordicum TaxID=229535 RepID=A0A0M8P641_9EURO|nr:hypothetical protein ACN38_g3144 [Penicillium nordicum]